MSAADEKAIDRALRGLLDRESIPQPANAIDHPTMRALADLAANSGAAPAARPYLIWRMRYTLGKGPLQSCPASLRDVDDWLKRRAWDLLDQNRHRLPPLIEEREPRS
jgi:hypothetical protein